MTLRLAVFGVGRLGREILALAALRGVDVVCSFARDTPVTADALRQSAVDVAIDVSVADAVRANVGACMAAGVPCVIGTTGWQEHEESLRQHVAAVAGGVLVAPNFSIGAVLFSQAVASAAQRFTQALGFDAHIVETHHAMKVDAPSGTARRLEQLAAKARGTAIPVTSVRVGHVPGTHTLVLDAPFEQVTLTHDVRDRRVFADGALLAAHWMRGKHGWFVMDDVVSDLTGAST
jgi:4-hydroxy-tetrahydrodipicolinate reductase